MNRCARCSGAIPAFVVFCPHCAQALEPNFDQLINLIIDGRYRIYRRLGQVYVGKKPPKALLHLVA